MNPLIPDRGMGAAPQGPMAPSQGDIDKAHEHIDHLLQGLMGLAQKPQLTKQDVFKSAADLMAKGIFSSPESQMGLISELTKLPDDEMQLRSTIGQQILELTQMQGRLHQHHGPPGGAQPMGMPDGGV